MLLTRYSKLQEVTISCDM